MGRNVVDLTVPGWIASPDNIAVMLEKRENVACGENDTVVFDLFNNLFYRFEQFDGSLSQPYK